MCQWINWNKKIPGRLGKHAALAVSVLSMKEVICYKHI